MNARQPARRLSVDAVKVSRQLLVGCVFLLPALGCGRNEPLALPPPVTAEIPVTFKMKQTDGEWFAYDVVIEGVSLVNNYRQVYAAIVNSHGMDGLLQDLEGKISDYKVEQGNSLN